MCKIAQRYTSANFHNSTGCCQLSLLLFLIACFGLNCCQKTQWTGSTPLKLPVCGTKWSLNRSYIRPLKPVGGSGILQYSAATRLSSTTLQDRNLNQTCLTSPLVFFLPEDIVKQRFLHLHLWSHFCLNIFWLTNESQRTINTTEYWYSSQ